MKKILFLMIILFAIMLVAVFGTRALALSDNGIELEEPISDPPSSGEILDYSNESLPSRLVIDERVTITGSLSTEYDIVISEGADVTLDSCTVTLVGGASIRIQGGRLTVLNSLISSEGTAVRLEGMSSGTLLMSGGRIYSSGAMASVIVRKGTAVIESGTVESSGGACIENYGTLYLGKGAFFSSSTYDVYTEEPILLSYLGEPFAGRVKIKCSGEFKKGTLTVVATGAGEGQLSRVTLVGEDGSSEELAYFDSYPGLDEVRFLGVYKPYTVTYIANGISVGIEKRLSGERIEGVSPPDKVGYEWKSWCTDELAFTPYNSAEPVLSDMTLYASYKLLPPSFTLKSKTDVYDGQIHRISFTSLTHPLSGEGFFSYVWIKEGEGEVSYSAELDYKECRDSGRYKCIVSFFVGRDSVTVETPYIDLTVMKQEIDPPIVPTVTYDGEVKYPSIGASSLYGYDKVGYKDAGTYYITLTLVSGDNYCWRGETGDSVTVEFVINRAENGWIDPPRVSDVYFGYPLVYGARAKFGEVAYLFSTSPDGEYTTKLPSSVGKYYFLAEVKASGSYTGIRSEPVAFFIIDDAPSSISVSDPPYKVDYSAFERFDASGLTLSVNYKSGKRETVSYEDISIYYQTDTAYLRYGDSAVVAEYRGLMTTIPIKVSKAKYTFGELFQDVNYVFDGKYKGYPDVGGLPTGIDGIPLKYTASGGGTSAGSYSVTVTFSTESRDYEPPEPINLTLTVEPLEKEVAWGDREFVFDGSVKCPSAYFTDVNGARVYLSVSGGAVSAGESYLASASSEDKNYRLTNSEISFNIAKADYDMSTVRWSCDSFVYNGEIREVTLSGLPGGVKAIGYTDNAYSDAGVYTASATLSYDSENYNPPFVKSHTWRIEKATYDMSGISFLDSEYVYDGELHYPKIEGEMPVGADGIPLGFSFSRGVKDVFDSPYLLIEFTTESENYRAPEYMISAVKILPKPITVEWGNTRITYSGDLRLPTAYSDECEITVEGGGISVGEYMARASASDKNYTVTNPECIFYIERAENGWQTEPSIDDIFYGGKLKPIGEAVGGEVIFKFYSDAECKSECTPEDVGAYYLVAYSDGGENYEPISSSPIEFRIIAIIPIELEITLKDGDYFAFDKVSPSDIVAYAINNDGSRVALSEGSVDVRYSGGDCLLVGNGEVTFIYSSLEYTLTLDVKKATFDTSGATWVGLEHFYNGETKAPYLSGLPSGIRVIDILGAESPNAGEYVLSPVIEYDRVNYEPPILPKGTLVIKRQHVTPESLGDLVYNGEYQTPLIRSDLYYPKEDIGYLNAGEYKIPLVLTDSENYVFKDVGYATLRILPREISVKLNDISVRLFEDKEGNGYRITSGEIALGDDLLLEYVFTRMTVSAKSGNPNYVIKAEEGKITYSLLPSKAVVRAILVSLGLFLALAILFGYAARHKDKIRRLAVIGGDDELADPKGEFKRLKTVVYPRIESKGVTSVDKSRADELITNSIAKALLRRSDEPIVTKGRRKAVVNIDTLSETFEKGERVDINILKDKGIIPQDAGSYKVLARGVLDKPLIVYADDFSITAVKMIALTGGEAYKVQKRPFKMKF